MQIRTLCSHVITLSQIVFNFLSLAEQRPKPLTINHTQNPVLQKKVKQDKNFTDNRVKEANKATKITVWIPYGKNQQEHPPDCGWDCDAFALEDLRLTSTISSCFAEESVSIPGNAAAIFRNKACSRDWQIKY